MPCHLSQWQGFFVYRVVKDRSPTARPDVLVALQLRFDFINYALIRVVKCGGEISPDFTTIEKTNDKRLEIERFGW